MQDRSFLTAPTAALVAALVVSATAVLAGEPNGEWLVEDGLARIRVEKCTDRYWGVVSWEKTPGGLDTANPDPAKRTRPTLGMPILLGMATASDPDAWEGEIYNSRNGKTYSARIILKQPDVLRVEGCLVGGFLCGGQNWSRVPPPPPQGRPPTAAQIQAAVADFCSKLPVLPGTSH